MGSPGTHNPLREAALEYAAMGWRVVPLHGLRPDGTCTCGRDCGNSRGKHPRLPRWQDHASDDLDAVARWWDAIPLGNVGVKTGGGSGIVAVDVDPPSGEEFLRLLSGGDLPETVEMRTGKGRRLLYAIPDQLEHEPRTACFKDAGGDESIRLQGGTSGAQFVAPPSRHWSGRVYEWVPGRSPGDMLPAPMPTWVMAEMCRPPEPEWAERASDQRGNDQDTPWVDFNRRETWDGWLTDWGYKPAGGRTEVKYYTRPGKAGGVSVSVGHYRAKDGTPALYTFSGNCPELPGAKCYDLFGAYSRVVHGGDFSAAARHLLSIGYGKTRQASLEERVRRLEVLVKRLVAEWAVPHG